jgi:hypothetical protein
MQVEDTEVAECKECDDKWVGEGSFEAAYKHTQETGHSVHANGVSV